MLKLAHEIAEVPDSRELDALAATGEQVSAALVAMTLQKMGARAQSFLGHQIRVHTDGAFTKARIRTIAGTRLKETVQEGKIAVVAGFQGVDSRGNIPPLGRGG